MRIIGLKIVFFLVLKIIILFQPSSLNKFNFTSSKSTCPTPATSTATTVRISPSGAAPLDPQVRGFLREIFGCMILESYGSTECCGSGSATSFANYQLEDGCVGPPQPWNEIKLESVEEMGYHSRDGVGEVCIRGDNIL